MFKVTSLFFVALFSAQVLAMSTPEEILKEKQENPKGAQAALCWAYAVVLGSETTPENKPVDKLVVNVMDRADKQGTKHYGDNQVFGLKATSAMMLYMQSTKGLKTRDSAKYFGTLAEFRTIVQYCSKNLEP